MNNNTIRSWRNKGKYRLIGTRCSSCNNLYYPSLKICKNCKKMDGEKLQDEELSNVGKVVSYTTVYKSTDMFSSKCPYSIGIINIDGTDIRVVGQIISVAEEKIKIGMKVKVVYRIISTDGERGLIHYGIKWKVL